MPSETPPEEQFCRHCGAGKGIHRRAGEGTCPKCDPEGRDVKLLRDLAQAVITEYNVCVGNEGPSWDLCHQAEAALSELANGNKP